MEEAGLRSWILPRRREFPINIYLCCISGFYLLKILRAVNTPVGNQNGVLETQNIASCYFTPQFFVFVCVNSNPVHKTILKKLR